MFRFYVRMTINIYNRIEVCAQSLVCEQHDIHTRTDRETIRISPFRQTVDESTLHFQASQDRPNS